MKKVLSLLLVTLLALAPLAAFAAGTDEVVDGKFATVHTITVELFNRSNDGGSKPEDNPFANYIKEGMLRDHNVEVIFKTVPRFPEDESLNNLLAAGDAPDVCVTYSYPTILTYANMGGVLDLAPLIEQYGDYITDLRALITDDNLLYNLDNATGKLWAIEARQFNLAGQKTFIREDWLAKLGLPAPTTLEEFEATLRAFRDNAETLLGADADKMIPFLTSSDVGWGIIDLADAVIPGNLTDKDLFVYGFDDRRLLYPNYKEAVRILNSWYNEGLVWKDFALYPEGDTTHGNLIKAGYVGAYMQNADDPYRNGPDGPQMSIQKLVGPEAAYTTIQTFKNDEGVYQKYWAMPIDRKVFFPATNDEPLASLMYINFISKLETRMFLQLGKEGENHEKQADGTYKIIPAVGEYIQNSLYNIDYTITCNGLNLDDADLTRGSLAQGYGGIDPSYIIRAYDMSAYEITFRKNPGLGAIAAEDGMGTVLKEKRNALLNQAAVAPADQFDAIFDAGIADYLASGGQAIIDERTAAWEAKYGAETMLP